MDEDEDLSLQITAMYIRRDNYEFLTIDQRVYKENKSLPKLTEQFTYEDLSLIHI